MTGKLKKMIDIGELTKDEWNELVCLDYVLTWRFSDDEEKDLKRQRELRKKRYETLTT